MAKIFDENEQKELLDSIAKYGSLEKETAVRLPIVVYSDAIRNSTLLRTSSGLPAWYGSAAKKFKMIFDAPDPLSDIHPAYIRCCLCNQIISYPCWYFVEKYNITQKHYFVCSSIAQGIKDDKVTTKCLAKRGWKIR